MARQGSIAIGGYYKTPQHITKAIAGLFNFDKDSRFWYLVDPCAADGEAIFDFGKELKAATISYHGTDVYHYTAELEQERHQLLRERSGVHNPYGGKKGQQMALHGDAFCVNWNKPFADVLWLNPPYDQYDGRRLEGSFLDRFSGAARPGGILVYIVPGHILAREDVAQLIVRDWDVLGLYRFPNGDFEVFKQVVLIGRRREQSKKFLGDNFTKVHQFVNRAANFASFMPVDQGKAHGISCSSNGWQSDVSWTLEEIDYQQAAAEFRPWTRMVSRRQEPLGVMRLDLDYEDVIGSTFPTVMPPKPAHVAIALASGIINGRRVGPDKADSGLPNIVVKGIFHKEAKILNEKTNKDGETTAYIAVQQPRLEVTVLALYQDRPWAYHRLKEGTAVSGATELDRFNLADLLTHYGLSLAALLEELCPALYNPAVHPQVNVKLGVDPFRVQADSITAALRLLATQQHPFDGEMPKLFGEVGTGKTLSSLAVAEALTPRNFGRTLEQLQVTSKQTKLRPVKRVLVLCPPHLLEGWQKEVAKVLPGATSAIIQRTHDVAHVATLEAAENDLPGSGLLVMILSREMAKLGHGWVDGRAKGQTCPTCGKRHADLSDEGVIKRREVCSHRPLVAGDIQAEIALWLAQVLAALPKPNDAERDALLPTSRYLRRLSGSTWAKWVKADEEMDDVWARVSQPRIPFILSRLRRATAAIMQLCQDEQYEEAGRVLELVRMVLWGLDWPGRDEFITEVIYGIAAVLPQTRNTYGDRYNFGRKLMGLAVMMTDLGGTRQAFALQRIGQLQPGIDEAEREVRGLVANGRVDKASYAALADCRIVNGTRYWQPYEMGQSKEYRFGGWEILHKAFGRAVDTGTFEEGPACNTPLFGATPSPRRYPVANYIARRYRNLFDLLILDEAHEYRNDGNAQERAASLLIGLGKPVIPLTGTSNNGYSSSLFLPMWNTSARFRQMYGRHDLNLFVTRNGYRKVLIEPDDDTLAEFKLEYGSYSNRAIDTSGARQRLLGEAPGVLPLFVFRHLLPSGIFMQKRDLDIELPPAEEIAVPVTLAETEEGEKLLQQYGHLRDELIDQIVDDLHNNPDMAGKLWGQLAQLPTYLDRAHADTGNADFEGGRLYEIRYPKEAGGALVANAEPLDVSILLPKEEWLLDRIEAELEEDRPCMVLCVNTNSGLAERLQRLVDGRFGKKTAIYLNASKVDATKRQSWIDKQVVQAGRKVMIVNPKAVETGLNNLVYFPTGIWFQNPNCSPIAYMQANGRLHRPGQDRQVRFYVPYYRETIQEDQFILLGLKVEAVLRTDGLDVTSALIAAGAGSDADATSTMSVGQALYKMLTEGRQKQSHFRNGLPKGSAVKLTRGNGVVKPEIILPAPEVKRPKAAVKEGAAAQLSLFSL